MLEYAREFSLVCIAVFFIIIGSVNAVNEHYAFIALLFPAFLQMLYHVLSMRANAIQRGGVLDFKGINSAEEREVQSIGRGYIQMFACLLIITGLFGIIVGQNLQLGFCVSAGMLIYALNYRFHQ